MYYYFTHKYQILHLFGEDFSPHPTSRDKQQLANLMSCNGTLISESEEELEPVDDGKGGE